MKKVFLNKISRFREIDYFQLKSALANYANPHAKIRQLLATGALIRIKKGLYVLSDDYNDTSISMEILANLIYGPSAISLDYALHYYGLIPEHVRVLTSITPQRDKFFDTPIGLFSYRYLTMSKYCIGLTQLTLHDGRHTIMASPEKALIDKIHFSRLLVLSKKDEVEHYFFSDLRLNESILKTFDLNFFSEIMHVYNNKNITAAFNFLKEF